MKVFYNGREIAREYAQFLEDNGQAHMGEGGSGTAPDGSVGGWVRMDRGPGNIWLEKQPPEKFLMHVFGHTCTWKEMAQRWGDEDEYGLAVVATMLDNLNYWILQALRERRERAELAKQD